MNSILAGASGLIKNIRKVKPLIQHITNSVTMNDCANVTLAIGASPIMADEAAEVREIVAISQALVINTGTLNKNAVESMFAAAKEANKLGVPVVLDPVGAGASSLRNRTVKELLEQVRFSVVRGNLSEIRFIAGLSSTTKGVDASEADLRGGAESAAAAVTALAQRLGSVVAVTGAVDVVAGGGRTVRMENGHKMLGSVTGTGCMCTSLIGSACGAVDDYFAAAVAGILYMSVAGEIAFEKAGQNGSGSFHIALIDAISRLDARTVEERARLYEA